MSHTDDDVIEERREGAGRRSEDVQRVATLIGLASLILSAGVAWATTTAKVDQKADREEFRVHVVAETSTVNLIRQQLTRMEAKQDSANKRVSNLICEGKPKYCQ